MRITIPDNATILFQGDSITDCGRDYKNDDQLGLGYAKFVAAWYQMLCPEKNVTFINRGISGNRAGHLRDRWQKECIDLKPDVVSILIGINDVWRRYDSNDPTSVETYMDNYRAILTQVRDELGAQLILLEPFVLPTPEDRLTWREDLDPKIQAARALAREFDATYVPLDGLFAQACSRREASHWAEDGVHPSPAGHALIAQAWLQAVGAM